MVYFIGDDGSEEAMGDRVHAHDTIPVIRAGNQLVLTFADGPADPNRRLFVMYRTLGDTPPLEDMPTPILTARPVQISSPTPTQSSLMPERTATAPSLDSVEVQSVPGPDLAFRVALIPTLLILAGTMIFQWLERRKS